MDSLNKNYDDSTTIPHATRYDSVKTGLYALIGLGIAFVLVAGTVWLFVTG